MGLDILQIANKIFWGLILLATVIFAYRIKYISYGFKRDKKFPKSSVKKRFCILVPARNESNVIERLLESLKKQNYDSDKFDVYVIVESESDKSIDIAHSFGYNAFVRKDLNNIGKGYALDECIQDIFTKKIDYDILTIIDADNILAPNMLEEFNNAYCYGYPVGNAYRRQLNEQGNWLADCSTLTFAGMNTFQNKARTLLNRNIIMSGSGMYVDFNIIKQLKGWPFTTLTEDYELSMWCCIHNIPTAYIPTTYYYDEQPMTLTQSRKQRVRWIKGYFQVRKKYNKSLKQSMKNRTNIQSKLDISIGIVPNVLYIASIIIYELFNLVMYIYYAINKNPLYIECFKNFWLILFVTYIILQMYTLLQLRAERDQLNYNIKNQIKILLLNPIYITLYIPFAIEALFSKNISWTPIKHGEAKKDTQITQTIQEENYIEEGSVRDKLD